jgi:hypothetical protein
MMKRKLLYRVLLLVVLFTFASLGCQLVNNIKNGVNAVSTGRAVVSEVGALATQIIPGGLDETAQAIATKFDESGIVETAQSAITEQVPEIKDTVQAISTEVYTSPEGAPADIPIMDGERSAFIGTSNSVTYTINADFNHVVDFYRQQMPINGWQQSGSGNSSSENLDQTKWEKGGRTANVLITQIPFVGQEIVTITIEGS